MKPRIAVVIPAYRVKERILAVISEIGPEVHSIIVVDDRCPEGSGKYVQEHCRDKRVQVLFHDANQGVGGAVMTGYSHALTSGATIIVKIDGDGQMSPQLIPPLIRPLVDGRADYAKGNRFYDLESLTAMPKLRLLGNSVLSFLNKIVSGYWNIMDPTNGFTAIHSAALKMLPLHKIEKRYFFESDMLFRLNTIRAVVTDVPMEAVYKDEESNLRISKVLIDFPSRYASRFFKRIFYNYFLRDFSVCSVELISGTLLVLLGCAFGAKHWYLSIQTGIVASTGTVMLAALPVILGSQLLLAALHLDVMNVPRDPLSRAAGTI
jgi:glycosyltransferase involved in cell wall biosynthesis